MVSDTTDPVAAFNEFIREYRDENGNYIYREQIQEMTVEGEISLKVDFSDVIKFNPELARRSIDEPREFIEAGNRAVTEVVEIEDSDYAFTTRDFFIRFHNMAESETIPLRGIRTEHVGKLIMLNGITTRATVVKPLLVEGFFQCQNCQEIMILPQEEGRYNPPHHCQNPGCGRAGPFNLLTEESKFVDWQKVTIQERPENLPPGQMPRSVTVLLKNDMVDKVRPGDRISVIGVLQSIPDFSKKTPGKLATFHINMNANYVFPEEQELESLEISEEEEQLILELARDPWIHSKIVDSIAPSIYGNKDLKESIALLLFGGIPKELPDGMKIRGESNLLLIGDPGTAKSQILRYIATLAPRALYTSGKGTSAAGLTVAVLRDTDTGEFTLEAGALVLSDRGVCCIDELDKMRTEDRSSIHEAMEQRTVSVAKAGIVATLNARCSIIAAANPKFGRYIPSRSAAENINLPVTILSRFDLIWIVRDEPEVGVDQVKAQHILRLHTSGTTEKEAPIPKELLKKYIGYAKMNSQPRLSEEAAKRLEDFYLEMRKAGESSDSPIAITPRQLESLIRLTESHARMALRNEASIEDAEAAIRILSESLRQVGIDPETGKLDIDVVMVGASSSTRSKIETLMDLIAEMELDNKGQAVPLDSIIEKAQDYGMTKEFIERNIERMRQDGMLFQPKTGFIKRT
ncbi:MAG: minichromosome maintenance protein MCM [Candidatus Heimdallarchaeota archaeon]|nr:minichromosome maintenance protein MCM [Candidatus Heimdallarchaeota archaeon]MBY8995478.1 minichromosome maintenance protein MCM [Candidatus Heimdallarchaeota archaeon]